MSCQNNFLKCLDDIDLTTLHEFLTPANSVYDHGPIESYYTPEELSNFCSDNYSHNEMSTKLSCIHINSRSLCHNFDQICSFLNLLSYQPAIIGISETWINANSCLSLCNLENYVFINNPRKEKRGGGVGIYIRNDINYTRRLDLDINTCFLESIFIEIKNHNCSTLICVMYRPPNQAIDDFLSTLDELLQVINREKSILYMLGDFNLNLLNIGKVQSVTDFLDLLLLHSMYPLVKYPTRVAGRSSSVIDNIITNDTCSIKSGIILTDISDHYPVYSISDTDLTISNSVTSKGKRKIHEENIVHFLQLLRSTQWPIDVYNSVHVDTSFDSFTHCFSNMYDVCFPVSSISTKFKRINKPWFSNEIRKLSIKKCRMYKMYVKNPSEYRKNAYKQIRNKVTNMIILAKKQYYTNRLNNSKGQMKKTWDVINHAMGRNCKKSVCKQIMHNDELITDTSSICENFNDYFVNIGYNLNRSFDHLQNMTFTNQIPKNNQTASFKPITCSEIITIVDNFKSNTSAGFDDINVKVVKRVIPFIVKPLCAIFNQCISQGKFPNKMKIAKVIPVFKGGAPDVMSNYRPISVLPIFSKILEKCIYNRLYSFISKCNIINNNQYGFRAGHSTSSALVNFVQKVVRAIDNKEILIGLFLDLSKAFDTLDHQILLNKLHLYGIRGSVLDLFKSYLTNRKQHVVIENVKSENQQIKCGVPQGSILGPLLFLLYINDISHISHILQCILFADDTSIFLSHKNKNTLQTIFNQEINLISQWLSENKLTINIKKTHFMVFTKKKCSINDFSINMCGSLVKQVSSLKFLGVTIDNKLDWSDHINVVCNTLSKNIGILYKLKHFPKSILKMLYNSFILPYLYNNNIVWGNASATSLDRIVKLQKRVVRIINHAPYLAKTSPIFCSLKILRFNDLYLYQVGIFMYLCYINALPESLLAYFNLNHNVHSYNTRNANNFHLPKARLTFFQNSILFHGPKIWNSLPPSIKESISLKVFKTKLKDHFLATYEVD